MATYTGINHLAMVTKNMDMTVRFWRDFLGMRLVAGLGTGRYRHYFFEISAQDMRKHPKMLDRNPSPTAREGSEPVPEGGLQPGGRRTGMYIRVKARYSEKKGVLK